MVISWVFASSKTRRQREDTAEIQQLRNGHHSVRSRQRVRNMFLQWLRFVPSVSWTGPGKLPGAPPIAARTDVATHIIQLTPQFYRLAAPQIGLLVFLRGDDSHPVFRKDTLAI
jgi:hypothetical protein